MVGACGQVSWIRALGGVLFLEQRAGTCYTILLKYTGGVWV